MASEKHHREKAAHNQRFLDTISDDFADWMAIVAFYKAVHLVEMLLAADGHHSTSHRNRDKWIRRKHTRLWRDFYALKNLSEQARYDCTRLDANTIRSEIIGKRLANLEGLVTGELQEIRASAQKHR